MKSLILSRKCSVNWEYNYGRYLELLYLSDGALQMNISPGISK